MLVAGRDSSEEVDAGPPRGAPAPDYELSRRRQEDRRLLQRYHRSGDPALRTALVERFMPLARSLARRYEHAGEPLDDLVQVASLGLLNAIDRYDPSHETAFSSFAVPTIQGELKRYFRDKSWSVRMPRSLQESAQAVERAERRLLAETGRPPTAQAVADALGLGLEQVLEAREAASAYHTVPLDRPRVEGEEGESLGESLGTDDPGFDLAEDAATVSVLLRVLGQREREILRLRFAEDLTQSEIAERVGVSQMHVSRLIRRSIAELQAAAEGRLSPAPFA